MLPAPAIPDHGHACPQGMIKVRICIHLQHSFPHMAARCSQLVAKAGALDVMRILIPWAPCLN